MSNKFTSAHWGSYRAQETRDGVELKPIDGDQNPSIIGRGWVSAVQDHNLRVTKPAVRKGWLENREKSNRCDDSFVEVDWDTALDLTASELNRVRSNFGNEAIFAGSYGWSSAGRFHHAQSQMRRFMNTIGGFTSSRNTYSHAAAEILFPYITGLSNRQLQDQMTSLELVADHCELLVCLGGISGRTAQITSSGTSKHEVETWLERARKNGVKIANISPQKSDYLLDEKSQWISIRPNTDTALMLGVAHSLVERGLHKLEFLDTYCSGWDKFEAYLTGHSDSVPKTAEWASSITDIPANSIIELAVEMASHKTMISLAWGIQRADHGEQPIWMALTLAAMLGQIGQKGTGFSFGYGSTTAVGRSNKLLSWPSLSTGHNPVDNYIPVSKVSDMLLHPNENYKFDGQDRTYPDIKLVYWAGGNPFHHHQDLHRLEKAWKAPETVIVNEQWWTATAKRADIVFPATSPLERTDIMMNRRDPTLIWMDKLLDAPTGSRNDFEIFKSLAQRMGTVQEFTEGRSESDWLAHLWEHSSGIAKTEGFDLPEFEEFKRTGVFQCPEVDETRVLFQRFIADPKNFPLDTVSGKIEIFSSTIEGFELSDCPSHPSWIEPKEWLGVKKTDGSALHLISGQPLTRLHGQLDNGSVSKAQKIKGREPVYLHPKTATAHQISNGDIVTLANERGKCLAGAVLTEDIRPDTIALATGAWLDLQNIDGETIEVHGNPNVLTIDSGASQLSQGNIAHTCLVWISKWESPLPDIKAHQPPSFE